jgi:hypothetical protein
MRTLLRRGFRMSEILMSLDFTVEYAELRNMTDSERRKYEK